MALLVVELIDDETSDEDSVLVLLLLDTEPVDGRLSDDVYEDEKLLVLEIVDDGASKENPRLVLLASELIDDRISDDVDKNEELLPP